MVQLEVAGVIKVGYAGGGEGKAIEFGLGMGLTKLSSCQRGKLGMEG